MSQGSGISCPFCGERLTWDEVMAVWFCTNFKWCPCVKLGITEEQIIRREELPERRKERQKRWLKQLADTV